ncbi:MAG: hypothetical protein Greene101449_1229 [Candidatus Peregrinibacteria bacterium Greene1014_49]|nr:MAG: hypothetical protein Greene101449_1229 [Candidatus Peregrinibacteria bacterium Greene1014_49]
MRNLRASIGKRIHRFWFRPVSAAGFGLMRIAFGVTTLINLSMEARNVERYFGPSGILPRDLVPSVLRQQWRFSLLDYVGAETTGYLYLILLACLVFVILGVGTRLMLLISLVLLYSFHEYGIILLDSGDSLLHLIGFILLLSPCNRTFTLKNLERKCQAIAAGKEVRPKKTPTMPIWPYRLLLWQMVLIYVSCAYAKMSGPTWFSGSAIAIAIHHGHFSRFPIAFTDWFTRFSPSIGYFTIFTQLGWALLIILPMFAWIGIRIPTGGLKRFLIFSGIIVHTGILVMMDVGTFSLAVFTAYFGLLLEEDFEAIKKWRTWIHSFKQEPLGLTVK